MTENDSHLFFHCSFARAIWFSARPSILTSRLPIEQDGVEEAIPLIINTNTSYHDLKRIVITLWYIWKARNDARFGRKKWSVLQVHHFVQAEMELMDPTRVEMQTLESPNVASPCRGNQHSSCFAGTIQSGLNSTMNLQEMSTGTRCYTDASLAPDNSLQGPRQGGLGVFLISHQQNESLTICVKAKVQNSTSVIMAESAALALGAKISQALSLSNPSFWTDNQQLVHFFNGDDHDNPPDWAIKPYTQTFLNIIQAIGGNIRKIDRAHNVTAHTLATQAFRSSCKVTETSYNCTNPNHVQSCPLRTVIDTVSGDSITIIAASCC